jgi:prolipoprotein diacylglyceryltransferase
LFDLFSMGSILSLIMLLAGLFILIKIKNNEIYK